MNSAKFITGNFQRHLRDELGWEVEKQINGQDVDAYKEFENVFEVFTLSEDRYVELLEAYEAHHRRSAGPTATSIYIQHCQNAAPSLSEDLKPLESFFVSVSKPIKLRVAIEFETGNVASSFRAANKLEYLYRESQIDLGIFITSNDKPSCAVRIWPVTNRNGSFQELDRRGFANGLGVPLWQVGFAPDAFDQQGLYLAEDGSLYTMQATNRRKAIDGLTYEIWTDTKGQERLRLEAYSST